MDSSPPCRPEGSACSRPPTRPRWRSRSLGSGVTRGRPLDEERRQGPPGRQWSQTLDGSASGTLTIGPTGVVKKGRKRLRPTHHAKAPHTRARVTRHGKKFTVRLTASSPAGIGATYYRLGKAPASIYHKPLKLTAAQLRKLRFESVNRSVYLGAPTKGARLTMDDAASELRRLVGAVYPGRWPRRRLRVASLAQVIRAAHSELRRRRQALPRRGRPDQKAGSRPPSTPRTRQRASAQRSHIAMSTNV